MAGVLRSVSVKNSLMLETLGELLAGRRPERGGVPTPFPSLHQPARGTPTPGRRIMKDDLERVRGSGAFRIIPNNSTHGLYR